VHEMHPECSRFGAFHAPYKDRRMVAEIIAALV